LAAVSGDAGREGFAVANRIIDYGWFPGLMERTPMFGSTVKFAEQALVLLSDGRPQKETATPALTGVARKSHRQFSRSNAAVAGCFQ